MLDDKVPNGSENVLFEKLEHPSLLDFFTLLPGSIIEKHARSHTGALSVRRAD
jgi:hypothetical protein